MQQKDPWAWVTLVALLVLLGTGWEWRRHHLQTQDLHVELTRLERDYRKRLDKLKKTREQQKMLQADIDQMSKENDKFRNIIRETEGSSMMIQQYANMNREEVAKAEELEELYLTRIDELSEQIRVWNENMLYREYIFRNRFPHFTLTCRILGKQDNRLSSKKDAVFKLRLPNIQQFPVEISSLSQMVKQQDANGVQLLFTKTYDNDDDDVDDDTDVPRLRLQQLSKPGGKLPEWPFKHHVALMAKNGHWYVITEPSPSLLAEQQELVVTKKSFGQIMEGHEFLDEFVDSPEQTLTLQVLAAERVVA